MKEVASVESVTVTVDASVARSIVILFGISASRIEAHVRFPLEAIVVAKVLAPQSVGLAASTVAVEALPVKAPMNVVVERASVVALYVRPASVAGARLPVAFVPKLTNVVVSPAASAKVTVPAFPVNAPTNVVEVTELSPASVVEVAPRDIFVEPMVTELLARFAFAIAVPFQTPVVIVPSVVIDD